MEDIRYIQRFDNFSRAYGRLAEQMESPRVDELSELEKEGVIQRFEYTFELLWKTLKDYAEYRDIEIIPVSPKNVVKVAANSRLLEQMDVDGEVLFDMIQKRNQMAHTYEEQNFQEAFRLLKDSYFPEIKKFYLYFRELTDD